MRNRNRGFRWNGRRGIQKWFDRAELAPKCSAILENPRIRAFRPCPTCPPKSGQGRRSARTARGGRIRPPAPIRGPSGAHRPESGTVGGQPVTRSGNRPLCAPLRPWQGWRRDSCQGRGRRGAGADRGAPADQPAGRATGARPVFGRGRSIGGRTPVGRAPGPCPASRASRRGVRGPTVRRRAVGPSGAARRAAADRRDLRSGGRPARP